MRNRRPIDLVRDIGYRALAATALLTLLWNMSTAVKAAPEVGTASKIPGHAWTGTVGYRADLTPGTALVPGVSVFTAERSRVMLQRGTVQVTSLKTGQTADVTAGQHASVGGRGPTVGGGGKRAAVTNADGTRTTSTQNTQGKVASTTKKATGSGTEQAFAAAVFPPATWNSATTAGAAKENAERGRPLTHFPTFAIDEFKIDQSFVRGLPADRPAAAIIAAVVSLAGNPGVRINAEGCETAEQLQQQQLKALGCDEVQGWLHGRPEPSALVVQSLLQQRDRALPSRPNDAEAA